MEHDGCRNCKYEHLTEHEEPCNRCKQNATDLYEPMTNADRIRQMSDEELAEFLDIVEQDGISSQCINLPCVCCRDKECSNCWKNWLQSEAE